MKPFVCLLLFLHLLLLSACNPLWGEVSTSNPPLAVEVQATNTPFQPEGYTPMPTVTLENSGIQPSPTPLIKSVRIAPGVPDELVKFIQSSGLFSLSQAENSDFQVIPTRLADSEGMATWIYALVAPFPTLADDISFSDIQSTWAGNSSEDFLQAGIPFWLDENTFVAFKTIWGEPAPGVVQVAVPDDLINLAWDSRPSFGIIPFESIQPQWKVISIDGQSPLHNDFNLSAYPLKVGFAVKPAGITLPETNRDPGKLTNLIMTGVTALVRSTAVRMENKGLLYPGEDIRDLLSAADLTHVSNEVPFFEDCPNPYPLQESLVFCSDPRYIALLEDIGTDIIELTGNHFQDYGSQATLYTIDLYDKRDWTYFGGGRNSLDAQSAKLVEHNGNKLAFIGCNPVGPEYSWATESRPGSAQCDFDFMHAEITKLRAEGYLPIATFQHYEYYNFYPTNSQIADFRSMAEAGAVIVSGSQSHFPQYMEFYGDTFIHYGLGNLFFDQMDYPAVGTRREFADRHVFYDGRYLGTELLTFMLEDYARPRPMTEAERWQFLQDIFIAGGYSE